MAKSQPFEEHIAEYEAWFETNRYAYLSEIAAIRAQLPADNHRSGFEIGVGSGRFAHPLGVRLGIEPSGQMRRAARERGITAVAGVAEAIPFAAQRFGFALMVTTICFLDDIAAAFAEAYRVLLPGGAFCIGFVVADSPIGRVYEQHRHQNVFYRLATFYTVEQVTEHLERAGFQQLGFTQTLFRFPDEMGRVDPVREGYGTGSFVVVRGLKPER
jgi:SAM-dependent methyltransferase